MPEDTELLDVAEDEVSHTFDSITDLDNISDTTVLAITFLLSAQVSLSALLLQSDTITPSWVEGLFVAVGLITMAVIFWSLNQIIKSLLPVSFYSADVGEPLLKNIWFPWLGNASPQFEAVEDQQETSADEDVPPYEKFADSFVATYTANGSIDDYSEFQLAKLYHYKQVGKRKSYYAGRGLAWLRWAVFLFFMQFTIALGGIVLT